MFVFIQNALLDLLGTDTSEFNNTSNHQVASQPSGGNTQDLLDLLGGLDISTNSTPAPVAISTGPTENSLGLINNITNNNNLLNNTTNSNFLMDGIFNTVQPNLEINGELYNHLNL